jgi:hypothetical protein
MRAPLLVLIVSGMALAQPIHRDALVGHDHTLRVLDAGFPSDGMMPFALDEALTDWSFGQVQSNFPTEVLCQRSDEASPHSANLGSLAPNVYVALAFGGPDGATAYRVAVNNAGPPTHPVLELAKARCGDAQSTTLESVTAGPGTALGDILPQFLGSSIGARGPDGRVCFVFRERSGQDVLGCLTPDATPVGVERWLTAAQLDLALTPDGGFEAAFPALADYTRVGYATRAPVFVPDGRVFALVTLTWAHRTSPGVTWARQWLVTQASASAPIVSRTPPLDVSQFAGQVLPPRRDFESPAFKAQRLFFHPATNTVLAWPLAGLELLLDIKELGFPLLGGLAFGVFDVASPGSGHLDLTWEVARYGRDARVHPAQQTASCQVAGGQLRCGFVEYAGGATVPHWKTLELDRAEADFDSDGLTGAHELAAGTSDFVADSDDDGASDGEEVELAATDPRDAGSGATARPRGSVGYGYSTLIQDRLPLRTVDLNPLESRVLCGAGRCVDRRGRTVFSHDAGTPLFADATGTVFAWRDSQGLKRQRLDAGAELVVPLAQYFAAVGLGADRLAVSSDGRLFPLGGPVPAVVEGTGVRVLWDPTTACDPARTECVDGGRPFDEVHGARVLAWDPSRERLLVAFQSKLDQRILAVALDGGVTVLRRGVELPPSIVSETIGGARSLYHSGAVPGALSQLGVEGFVGDWNIATGLLSGSAGLLPEPDRGMLFEAHGSGWAGAAVTNDAFDTDALDGVNELVPMSTALEPGDLLTWWGGLTQAGATSSVRVHLAKVGRRGALLRLPPGLADFQAPSALGRAPGGALCAVAKEAVGGPDVLFELLAPGPDGIPTRRERRAVSNPVDCAYAPDGSLHYLADGPPRVGRLSEGAVTQEIALEGGGLPRHLVIAPDGAFYVTRLGGPLACVAGDLSAATPSTLEVMALATSRTGALWALGSGGALLRLNPEGLCSSRVGMEPTGASLSVLESARLGTDVTALAANVVERADGRVVLQGTRWTDAHGQQAGSLLYFYNPESGTKGILNAEDFFGGVAAVPGARWCDPWGEGLREDEQHCLILPSGVPPRPDASTDASVSGPADAGPNESARPSGCGCQSAPLDGLALLGLWASIRTLRKAGAGLPLSGGRASKRWRVTSRSAPGSPREGAPP